MEQHLTDYELGWFVGILEGEGTFGYYKYCQIVEIETTDEDVVCKAAIIFERLTGKPFNIKYIEKKNPNAKPSFRLKAHGENARLIMRFVVKHMGARRRARIWQSLNRHIPVKKKLDVGKVLNIVRMRQNGTTAN